MIRTIVATFACGALALGLAACGERPQVVQYKQGTYQGKPDTRAYDNAPYNGNQGDWDRSIKQRQQAQNEYNRVR